MNAHRYYNIENYVCLVPRPMLEKSKLVLSCSLKEISKHLKWYFFIYVLKKRNYQENYYCRLYVKNI